MKITFLGTSHGLPDVDRYCSSLLLEVGENAYLIDAGAPVADLLLRRGIPYGRVKAIFNTHIHSDHMLGFLPLLSLINWYYRADSIDVFMPEEIGCRVVKDLLTVSDCEFNADRIRLTPYDETLVYDDGVIRVTPIATRHMAVVNRPSYALLVEAEGKKLLFSGDFNASLADFPAMLYDTPVDLFISECAHFSAEALIDKLRGGDGGHPVRCGRVLVTHIHPIAEKAPILEAAAPALPFPLSVARDGEEITL